MKKTMFDFDDGRGEVLAHRHINKNGELGGWVEDNCEVSEDSYISENSCVYNNSSVDNSSVDNEKITNTRQVYTQSPIGSRNDRCTATINEKKEIHVVVGCFRGTIGEFEKAVLKTHGHSNYGKEYLAFIENAKTSFKIWGLL